MELNPYQSPAEPTAATTEDTAETGFPVGLVFLAVLAALHIVVAGLLTLGGLIMHSPQVAIGGLVTVGFHTAILIGVLMRQEWARILLIWLCYVGVVTYAVQLRQAPWLIGPLIGFEVLTLLFAHSRRVRETTRRKSLAQAYVYQETPSDENIGE